MITQAPIKPNSSSLVISEVVTFGVHPEIVLDWRQSRFRQLGFHATWADYLAATRIDLHQMEALLAAGCSQELAARILAETAWYGEDIVAYPDIDYSNPPEIA